MAAQLMHANSFNPNTVQRFDKSRLLLGLGLLTTNPSQGAATWLSMDARICPLISMDES
jgi:hypothetical protein